MEYINKNLAAITAVATFGGGFFSLYFIVIYLSKFSWTLVWLIEYTDIIKIGIVLVSFVMSYIIGFYYWVSLCKWAETKNFNIVVSMFIYFIPVIFYGVLIFVVNFSSNSKVNSYQISMIALLVWTSKIIHDIIVDAPRASAFSFLIKPQLGIQMILILTNAADAMAQYVKQDSNISTYIVAEDRRYYNVKIIMLLSHHAVFLSNDEIHILKTDKIKDIVGDMRKYKSGNEKK